MNVYQLYQWMSIKNGAQGSTYNQLGKQNAYGGTSAANSFSQILSSKYASGTGNQYLSNIPASMDAIFEEASRTYGVDVNFLKAVGKAESGFDASATSSAGAMGVMQLMPQTAQSLGVSNPYDARQNIMGGAKYLSQMLEKYNGNKELALAAYNAGSGNVAKYNGVPPFKETQEYISRVLTYAGSPISTNQSVPVLQNAADFVSSEENESTFLSGITKNDAENLLELMRYQMEMKLSSAFSADDAENNIF